MGKGELPRSRDCRVLPKCGVCSALAAGPEGNCQRLYSFPSDRYYYTRVKKVYVNKK